jgi:3-hydroxyacyl-CoA dehydrogenase
MDIKTVGVIGAGTMGNGLAHASPKVSTTLTWLTRSSASSIADSKLSARTWSVKWRKPS